MNVRKFIAATARDALRKVKEMLGPDAIILSNRAIPGGVEIMAVAASDMETILPTPVREVSVRDDDFTVRLSSLNASKTNPMRAEVAPPLAPRPAPQIERVEPQEMPRVPAEIISAEMMEEIRSLRRMMEQHLAGAAWGESARSEPVKTEVLRQMLDAGFSPSFARELLAGLPRELSVSRALAWVKQVADRALNTISAESDIVDRGGRLCAGWTDRRGKDDDDGEVGCALCAPSRRQQGGADYHRRLPDRRLRTVAYLRSNSRRFGLSGEGCAGTQANASRSPA